MMRKKWILSLLLWTLLGVGLAGAGCGSAEDTFEPIPCDSDSDCPSGDICGISGTCVPL